jgi:hypothetical protein
MGRFLELAEKAERKLGETPLGQLPLHRDEVRDFPAKVGRVTQQEGENIAPTGQCYVCGGAIYWRRPTGGYVCAECHPDPRRIPVLTRIQ